jgi:hypothetical protein
MPGNYCMLDHSGLEQQQELTVYGVCATRRAPRLVLTHDPAIADRVSGQDAGKSPPGQFDAYQDCT